MTAQTTPAELLTVSGTGSSAAPAYHPAAAPSGSSMGGAGGMGNSVGAAAQSASPPVQTSGMGATGMGSAPTGYNPVGSVAVKPAGPIQVPLHMVADIRLIGGSDMIKCEDGHAATTPA